MTAPPILWHSRHSPDTIIAWLLSNGFHDSVRSPGERVNLLKGEAHFVVRDDGTLLIIAQAPIDTLYTLTTIERWSKPLAA